jgi:uncharacterized coiled-coil protein SlyX
MTDSAAPATNAQRIEALEFKVAYLERSLQELGDVVYRQQQLLEASEARYQRLLDRVESAERSAEPASGFEIPPHY